MAFYRFHFQSCLTPEEALRHVRDLVREEPGFGQSLLESFGSRPDRTPPFIGEVKGNEFRIYRDIRYRNSFLPRIRGHITSGLTGANIDVTMYAHPFTIIFMIIWLGGVGATVLPVLGNGSLHDALILVGISMFGIVLTLGGFYPEAFKARRILEEKLGRISL